ncbi:MAG: hypothetical protein Ct9H90mP6_11260 [Gammaproteobacteria bacterium]|nr:MAG: hypothetical protein Ct9H90mP6_11260 [Gammaproteobacteria bacterium]
MENASVKLMGNQRHVLNPVTHHVTPNNDLGVNYMIRNQ